MKRSLACAAIIALTIAPAAAQKQAAPRTYIGEFTDQCTFEMSGPGARGGSSSGKLLLMLGYSGQRGRVVEFEFEADLIPKVRAHKDHNRDVVVRLETDAGQLSDKDGGYHEGTSDSVGARWVGTEAEQAVALMKKARFYYVVAEGEKYGPFDATAKGRAGFSLEDCYRKANE